VRVTKHGEKRVRERVGVNKKSVDRLAQKALTEGIPMSRTKGRLLKYLTYLYFRNETADNIRVYGDKAYIFVKDKLITVLQIPQDITKDMKKMIKEVEKSEKKKS
jgi:hypothetical protein